MEPGMAATPPVAESDLELATPSRTMSPESQHASVPNSASVEHRGAVLPSPLLSPVTTAVTPVHLGSNDDFSNGDISPISPELNGGDVMLMDSDNADNQLSQPTVFGVPDILESFDSLPDKLQTYVMYQMLRRCNKQTLHFVANVVNPALKRDFLSQLPRELAMNIVKFLDVKSLCRAAQVSRSWRHIIDTDEKAWKDILKKDEFVMPPGELDQAHREGWAWQGLAPYETNLSSELQSEVKPVTPTGRVTRSSTSIPSTRSRKRKAASSHGSSKRRKTRHVKGSKLTSAEDPPSSLPDESAKLESAVLRAAAPELGLKSLRAPRLYKTIYRRHHNMRNNWMNGTEPYHIAFRAHGRHVVTCLQFDSDKIITGSDDTKIHVYNSDNGALRQVLNGHEGGVWALQYDGNTLVSGSTDRTVRVWDIEKGICMFTFQGHTSTVRCLVILKPTVVGHDSNGEPIMMPKEPLIITGSRDSTLRIWKLPTPNEKSYHQLPNYVEDIENPYFVRQLSGHLSSVRAIAAHGDTLVSGSYDSSVRVWKISTGETVHRLTGHTQKVYSVILDKDRNRCISGSMDHSVKIWSIETGACLLTLDGHTSLVGLLDLNHDRLVSAAADSTLRIWDPETGHCKNTLTAHTGAITCFQHDGQKVISGSDRTMKMWDVKTGECVRDLLTNLSGVWQVKFNERKCVAAVQRNNWTYIEVRDIAVLL
jgi:F-box and WD-40 domain protein CDC4